MFTKQLLAAMMCGGSLIAIGSAVQAQTAPANTEETGPQEPVDSQVEDVVVTGSRIVRDGYSAPTPVTVVATEQLELTAPGSIPDGLNQLPQFTVTSGTQNTGNQATSPNAGNYLNLRGLGSIRNLVLLDGQRIPPTSFQGTVDTNVIPSSLVSRVDVVTGGASAAYGSDAVSGVINFILDTSYTGVKGSAQVGISDYGDDLSLGFDIAAGFDVLEDRGHVLLSYDHYEREGIPRNEDRPRGGEYITQVGNGTAAAPYRNAGPVYYQTGTFGTLFPLGANFAVNNGNPLAGMHFLPDGSLVPFNPGVTPAGSSNVGIGGDGSPSIGKTLTGGQVTDQLFGRFDYDLTPDLRVFAQLGFAQSENTFVTIGSGTQTNAFYIYADNPYLPADAAALLNAYPGRDGVFGTADDRRVGGGRIHADQPFKEVVAHNVAYTFLTGISGSLGEYNWRATYAHGDSLLRSAHSGNFFQDRYFASLDAVRDPQGEIVCNITLTHPGLMDDCRPINWFGANSPTDEDFAWVSGVSKYRVSQKMDIVAAEISGDLFELPAGPVSFAAGAEYRTQELNQTSNSDPSIPTSTGGLRTNVAQTINKYNSTNVGSASGQYDVAEAFVELAVPLLADLPLVRALDLNGAARYTEYSTSGGVTTWKIGLSYTPFDDLRLRYTRSRDIRAPTLYELFAGDQAARGGFFDALTGRNDNVITLSSGNPDLKPEIGDTYTVGAVWQPVSFPGFSASVDYFNINITDAISNLSRDQANEECIASNGASTLCQYIIRPFPFDHTPVADNFPLATRVLPYNQALSSLHGIDYEFSYTFPVTSFGRSGDLQLRLIGSYVPGRKTRTDIDADPVQNANVGINAKHRINLQANYIEGPLKLVAQARYIGETERTRDRTVFYEEPTVPAVVYVDLTASYDFTVDGRELSAFLTVNNAFDQKPPLIGNGQPGQQYPTNQGIYDVVGPYYTTGIRFEF
jgi:iron complex outermembrane receptor protein